MAKPEAGDDGPLAGWERPILMIGCGNMAGAILARWLACGLSAQQVAIVDPARTDVAAGLTIWRDLPDSIAPDTLVLLGIKPQSLGQLAAALNALLGPRTTLISMLAGVPLAGLRAALPAAGRLVRIMPNLPVATGQGVVLTIAEDAGADEEATLLAPLGLVEPLEGEADFDLCTAISGCGPAFVYRFIDAMAAAGAALGLEPARAARLALHTVAGAALTALGPDQSPAERAERVASPGGMTREGLDVLDRDEALRVLLTDTLRAARDRGEVLARG